MSLTITLDPGKRFPISDLVYGVNTDDWSLASGAALGRASGNRWEYWDWQTGLSLAGRDDGNEGKSGGAIPDTYLDASGIPGEAARKRVAAAQTAGAKAFIVTIPIFSGPSPAGLIDLLEAAFPRGKGIEILYCLDNEPAIRRQQFPFLNLPELTYADMINRSKAAALIIRGHAPGAKIMGPVSWGWNEYVNLQNAADAGGRDWLEHYMVEMRGLLDVLDVHYYPQINNVGSEKKDAATVASRLDATRSLWDPRYRETSWVADNAGGPLRIVPRLLEKIARVSPGLKLAITEWSFGGEAHISGAIAAADALGIFGREGVYAANFWALNQFEPSGSPYAYAALQAMLRLGADGIGASVSDPAVASVYASQGSSGTAVVAINKSSAPIVPTWVGLAGVPRSVHCLTGDAPILRLVSPAALGALSLPPLSVSVLVFDGGASVIIDIPWLSVSVDGGLPIALSPSTGQPALRDGSSVVLTSGGLTSQPTVLRAPGPTPPPVTPPSAWAPPIEVAGLSTAYWAQVRVPGAARVVVVVPLTSFPLERAPWDPDLWTGGTAGHAVGAVVVRATRADGAVAERTLVWPG